MTTALAPSRNRRTDAAARRALAMPDMLAGKGASEVAKLHGVDESTVRRWMAEIKGDLLEQSRLAVEKLGEHVSFAVDRLIELSESDDEKIALGAVNSLLDRAGVVKTERHELTGKDGAPVAVQVTIDLASAKKIARGEQDG